MSYWDADAQRWVEGPGPSGPEGFGEPWQPPPDDSLRRMLIVVFVAVLLCGAAGTGIWWLARDHGGGHHPSAPPWPPPGFATDAPTDTPTFPDTTEPTAEQTAATDEPTTDTIPATGGPRATVTTYYTALNRGDYSTAWALGGKNLGQDYSSYVSGFAFTRRTEVTVLSVAGDTAYVNIAADQNDGTRRTYSGTYTVRNGVITNASVHQSGCASGVDSSHGTS
ncbi:hypothetical protein ACT1U9_09600 [Streptomyces sp. BR1]|uniref:hypothetical protein n=1 Tax=Streptomyces sp. BR1 TaxID=1592323 RepID=UPI00402BEA83